MGYLSSAPSDFLYELPLSAAFDVFVFQSPEAGLTGQGVFCPPGCVCESVECASPGRGWAVVEVPGLASGLSSCDAEYVV